MAGAILCASGIYAIRNTLNGKVYVGRAVNMRKRVARHFVMLRNGAHHSVKLQRAFDRHGEAAFVGEALLLCAPEHLGIYEQLCIDGLDAYRAGYNACPVSGAPMAGRTTSEATRRKQSEAMLGRPKPDSVKKKLSEALAGRKHSPERVEAIRAAVRRPEVREATALRMVGNKNSLGTVRSAEARAKYSACWTPERRAAQSARLKGVKMAPRKKGRDESHEAAD